MQLVSRPTGHAARHYLLRLCVKSIVIGAMWCLTACLDDDGPRRATAYHPFHTHTMLRGMRDICIVTQFTSNIDSYARIASDNHMAYAYRHGYPYSAFRGRISGPRFCDAEHPERLYRDGLYWQKIAAVQEMLQVPGEQGTGALCRWVMWVDADVLFTNFERPVETVLAPFETPDINPQGQPKNVVLARDPEQTAINAGVFFVKNTPEGHAFIDAVADKYDEYKCRELPEQEAMQDYVFDSDLYTPGRCDYRRMRERLRPDVAVMPQRTFNSFYKPGKRGGERYWERCDFIAHFAALNQETRIEHMERIIEEIEPCDP